MVSADKDDQDKDDKATENDGDVEKDSVLIEYEEVDVDSQSDVRIVKSASTDDGEEGIEVQRETI